MKAPRPEYRRLYKTARWRAMREQHLAIHPLCVWCKQEGRTEAATVVDHVLAHRGDERVFFDGRNLQGLCKRHHDGAAQSRDRTGRIRGCDVHGFPLDPQHPWAIARRARAN